jgi:glucan phosphoethanolaminetransferase (alkaline phosphatase superfamily)
MSYEIVLFFSEGEEIIDTLKSTIRYMFLSIAIFIANLTIIYITLNKFHSTLPHLKYANYILLTLFILGGIKIGTSKKQKYLPQKYFTSVRNTYYSVSIFFIQELPNLFKKSHKTFKNYTIKKEGDSTPQTIIVVMGESLSSKRMSLFDYKQETTPRLDKRKNGDNFIYKWGFSAGTVTKTSVVDFINIRREPENMEPIITQKANLFKLAKEQGYHTHYITTQKINILGNYVGYCDTILSDKDIKENQKLYDEKLIDYLQNIDFSKKNFIILHQRNSHSPYEENVPDQFFKYNHKQKDFHKYMLNSYLNSVLYTDYLLDKLFKIIDSLDKEAVAFVTSDHGEMLGFEDEKGQYGHTVLDFEVCKVPFLIYKNREFKNEINIKNTICHYDFSKLIAKTLGYKITNPNENDKCYINGTDAIGRHGFMTYDRKEFYEKYCDSSYKFSW